jgi:pSer/pThr/pTyr-binding forkhead associated (FHA) protein
LAIQVPVLARLVSVRRDGSDGVAHDVTGEAMDVGREQADLVFSDDPYLSERHCRFELLGDEWRVHDLGSVNGVYLKLTAPHALRDGDYLLLGKQVFRFDHVGDAERDMRPALQHGAMLFGSPLLYPWGCIRQLTVAGVFRDVHYLCRDRVTLGREDGDLVFQGDEFMSRQHLALMGGDGDARAMDLGSSNGTFVRLRDPALLKTGDVVRVGDQLLRFELP